ncbi:Deoxyribonuclease TATDN2 [Oopsacas minuta]|uniref:Deoxyribonuclease TATDN2 n=1 Tax=Oopsacas minuta TaxID=111878 RepID=A0AAV7K313_9METZ|nr:Deoxyribonuclease TATDN2 [Oopsacas minuta]
MAEGSDDQKEGSEWKYWGKSRSGTREVVCYGCGEKGHTKRNCPSLVRSKPTGGYSGSKKIIICYYCQDEGHVQTNCPVKFAEQESLQEAGNGQILNPPFCQGKGKGADKAESLYLTTLVDLTCLIKEETHYIDTHCHLEYVFERHHIIISENAFKEFMIANQYPNGFDGCISTFCDPTAFSSLGSFDQILKDPKVWATFGIHPHNSKYYTETLKAKLCEALIHPKCIALGEIGLDYSNVSPSDRETQVRILKDQLQLALQYNKPVQIHCRQAENELKSILLEELPKDWRIHLHCYTGQAPTAVGLIATFPNLYIGITGSITVKRLPQVRETASLIPLERILLETDAPYMIPTDLKDKLKFSHPIMILHVAERIAKIKDIALNEVLCTTRRNTKKMYDI